MRSSLLLWVDVGRGRSHADLRTCAGLQLLEVLHRRRLIRTHVEARGRIFGELHLAIGEPVVEPMGGDTETPGALRDRQRPGHMARMRLMPLLHEAMLAPDSSDRAREDLGPLRGAIALRRELGSDRVVRVSRGTQGQHLLFHRGGPLQVGEGSDGDRDRKGGRRPTFPHHTGLDLVPRRPMDDDLVNEAAPQRFALWLRQHVRRPQVRQRTAHIQEGRAYLRSECAFRCLRGLHALGRGRLGRLELAQSRLPAPLQCRRDQTIVGSDAATLTCTQRGLLPQPLQRWTDQGRPTVAFIQELHPLGQGQSIGGDTLL